MPDLTIITQAVCITDFEIFEKNAGFFWSCGLHVPGHIGTHVNVSIIKLFECFICCSWILKSNSKKRLAKVDFIFITTTNLTIITCKHRN